MPRWIDCVCRRRERLPPPAPSSQRQATTISALPLPATQVIVGTATPDLDVSSSLAPVERSPKTEARNVAWNALVSSLRVLEKSADAFGPLKSAVGGLVACIDLVEAAAENRKGYEGLASELKTMVDALIPYAQKLGNSGIVAHIFESIIVEVSQIRQRQQHGRTRQIFEASQDAGDVIQRYQKIETLFRQLLTDISLRTWDDGRRLLENALLQNLSPVHEARFNSSFSTTIKRNRCTSNTRMKVQEDLQVWASDSDGAAVYWMDGMAGTGKTTISYSLCEWLDNNRLLGGDFFCSRLSNSCNKAETIVPTLAYQLAQYSLAFRAALCNVLDEHPDAGTRDIRWQFLKLVQEPMRRVRDAMREGVVLVIDALDECMDTSAVDLFLDTVLQLGENLPIKFFLTSRPEPIIRSRMRDSRYWNSVLHLHDIEESIVAGDIKEYLSEKLTSMSPQLSSADLQELADRSGKLFIYAATAVRYILSNGRSAAARRLQTVLESSRGSSTKQYADLNVLYTGILRAALQNVDLEEDEKESMRHALWTCICVKETITTQTLASLHNVTEEDVISFLEPLRPVLHVQEKGGLVSALHASFPDYMLDLSRSTEFHCDSTVHSEFLAKACFDVMERQLKFNICNLESSALFDEQVPDLKDRIERSISPALSYSCRYWGEHLEAGPNTPAAHSRLVDFLTLRLLFWMEVLNLLKVVIKGVDMLQRVVLWSTDDQTETRTLLDDAMVFVTRYATGACNRSTPHIYISRLPFCRKTSTVYANYMNRTRGLVDVRGTAMEERAGHPPVVWMANSQVTSVAFSPDGTRVASGLHDRTIRVWDAKTGASVAGPFTGHEDVVTSVAFSPDGTRIVSGSYDKLIRAWNAKTGECVGGPFIGHEGGVLSVAFSPGGTHIVSGSYDTTIRVWDAQIGVTVAGPFTGHEEQVTSVAFSPDGTRIVSGSTDHTILVWDAQTGESVGEPFYGHEDMVLSVAFSPEGIRIASGSADKTILVWDAGTGLLVDEPLAGHYDQVTSIAFSPDGTNIVSGSYDHTIRVWDAQTGETVVGPFTGHQDIINSVAFSPDGTKIVSGSEDKTIRVWDARAGESVGPFTRHGHIVYSVAFSPDGTRIVSGLYGKTIRVWDAQTGESVGGPFIGHEGGVLSVAFSPDGTHIVSGSFDKTIRVWDARTGESLAGPFIGHEHFVNSVAYSPDGTKIVSGSNDATIRVWHAQTGESAVEPFTGHEDSVRSVAFSPDGTRIVSGSRDNTIRVWDAQTGDSVAGPFTGHASPVTSVAFSPDGTRVVSGFEDKTIRVWDSWTGASVAELNGHKYPVCCVAFSLDGTQIVSGADDATVRVWHAQTGEPSVGPFTGHQDTIYSVAFSPDGKKIVSGSEDNTIRVWDAQIGVPIPAEFAAREPEDQVIVFPDGTSVVSSADDDHSHISFDVGAATDPLPRPAIYYSTGDGWIFCNGLPFLWAPSGIGSQLSYPHNPVTIGPQGASRIDYRNAAVGRTWASCYISDSVL